MSLCFVLLLHFFISHAQIDTETMNIMIHHIFSRILSIGPPSGPIAVGGAAHLACFFTNPSSGLLNFRHDFRRTSSYIRTTPLAIFLLFDLPTRRPGRIHRPAADQVQSRHHRGLVRRALYPLRYCCVVRPHLVSHCGLFWLRAEHSC